MRDMSREEECDSGWCGALLPNPCSSCPHSADMQVPFSVDQTWRAYLWKKHVIQFTMEWLPWAVNLGENKLTQLRVFLRAFKEVLPHPTLRVSWLVKVVSLEAVAL